MEVILSLVMIVLVLLAWYATLLQRRAYYWRGVAWAAYRISFTDPRLANELLEPFDPHRSFWIPQPPPTPLPPELRLK